MEENNVNLLVPEDGLIDDSQFVQEPIQPIEKPITPVYEEAPVETYNDVSTEEVKPVEPLPIYEEAPVEVYDGETITKVEDKKDYSYNENPMAQIKLNNEEVEEEQIDPKDIKVDIKGNKSLWYVLGLGLFLLVVILVLPYFM